MREEHESYSLPARVLYYIGRSFLDSLPGKLSVLFFKSIHALINSKGKHRTNIKQIIGQTYFTGIEAIPLITLVATLLGSVAILQALTVMPKVGFGDFFGLLMVMIIIRELGPILTAFLIAGRTGAALSTYIGNMKVQSEVDALETLGIDPIRYLVMPAMLGGMLSLLMLTVIFNSVAIAVGFVVAKTITFVFSEVFLVQLLWSQFLSSILQALTFMDLIMIIVKPVIFGIIVTTNACYHGLKLKNDVREVPKAASASVVRSFILIVVSDMLLSLVYIFDYISRFSGMI